ncbi:MAG TPA: YetF domain-containing protein [Candidatus Udaeobacter sp.]|nr:YetF domain-containing protein [Candidatus Udaeobacter sp.]
MNTFSLIIHSLLGLGVEAKALTSLQVSMRGIIVFAATLVMVRLSSKRSLAEKTAFDAALMIIIASVLARAINGSAPFVPTLVVGFVLVLLHRVLALGAYVSHAFGILVKGKSVVLVEDGRVDQRNMRFNHISQHDLEEDMRLDVQTEDISKIKVARIERSGDISFIKSA